MNNNHPLSGRKGLFFFRFTKFFKDFAWLPVPILFVVTGVLLYFNQGVSYENPVLLTWMWFFFITGFSLFVTYLLMRSFLSRGETGMLLLAAGVLFWGFSGFLGSMIGMLFDGIQYFGNILTTIHNLCVWIAAFLHLAGILLLLHPGKALKTPGLHSLLALLATVVVIGFIILASLNDWLPAFWDQQQGGTLLRQVVLGSSIIMFTLSALLMARASEVSFPFLYWYCIALALMAVGLFGVLADPVHGGLINWTGRSAMILSGPYMLVAAVLSPGESKGKDLALDTEISEWRDRYRMLFQNIPLGIAYHQIVTDEQGRPSDYIFLRVNKAFEGLTGLKAGQVIGQNVTQVLPGIRDSKPDLIALYGKVALSGHATSMDLFFSPLNKHFQVNIYSPRKGFFVTLFSDISPRKIIEEELREVNRELNQFNTAMVGRELRMIELKKEINALNAIIGNPMPYIIPQEDELS